MEYYQQPDAHEHAETLVHPHLIAKRIAVFAGTAALVTAMSVGGAVAAEHYVGLDQPATISYSHSETVGVTEYPSEPVPYAAPELESQPVSSEQALGAQAVSFEVSAFVLPNGQN